MTDDELLTHLTSTRIAGEVATSRQSNVDNIDKMLAGDPDYHFGIVLDRAWTAAEVVAVMAKRVGIDPDSSRRWGSDRIDPGLTLAGLDAAGRRVARAAAEGHSILVATGHPTGLLSMYVDLVAGLAAAGATLLTPGDGRGVSGIGKRPTTIRYVGSVACLSAHADLVHSHRTEPMQGMLAALRDAGQPPPGLVVADHGWAGVAAQAGIPTVGFADTNDPGLFVAAELGLDIEAVPLDDNVLRTTAYAPLAQRLLEPLHAQMSESNE